MTARARVDGRPGSRANDAEERRIPSREAPRHACLAGEAVQRRFQGTKRCFMSEYGAHDYYETLQLSDKAELDTIHRAASCPAAARGA